MPWDEACVRRIAESERIIRDFVNDRGLYDRHFAAQQDEWHRLCVSMDALGDTVVALREFEKAGLGANDGEKYLRLYGVLQAVVLQQDAIQSLSEIFLGARLPPADDSGWQHLRELRNLSAGHPIRNTSAARGTIKRVFVSRPSISSKGLTLMVWDQALGTHSFQHVDLQGLYASYNDEACERLRLVSEAQQSRWP